MNIPGLSVIEGGQNRKQLELELYDQLVNKGPKMDLDKCCELIDRLNPKGALRAQPAGVSSSTA